MNANTTKVALSGGVDLSKKLLEQENAAAIKAAQEQIKKYKERMTKVVEGINQILVDNEINWQEWGEVIEVFNDRNRTYFNKVLISTINNREYVHQLKSSTGGKTDIVPESSSSEGQRTGDAPSTGDGSPSAGS